MFADDTVSIQMWLTVGGILSPIGAGIFLWLKAKAAEVSAKAAVAQAQIAVLEAQNAAKASAANGVLARENADRITKIGDTTMIAMDKLTEKIEEVHKATNSLTDRLVETTRIEAHAAGMKEQKDRPHG